MLFNTYAFVIGFFRGWALAMGTAHLIAQIRRRGVDRLQRLDAAERGRQPGQRAAGKAALQQHLGR